MWGLVQQHWQGYVWVGAGGLALSRIASDDCHVTTETQQLEEEELQEEAAGSFYGAEEDGC